MIKVSINIVTKNRCKLLKGALDSVLAQSFSNYEVVVVNDGSTDGTQMVIDSYKSQFSHFRTIINNESVGVKAARQQALDNSTGEFVANLDDDDTWIDPGKIAAQVVYLDQHPSIGLVGTFACLRDYSENTNYRWEPPYTNTEIKNHILIRSCFMNPTVMFRRMLAEQVGGYKKSPQYCEDTSLWMRIGRISEIANLTTVTTEIRLNNDGLTRSKNLELIKYTIQLILEHRDYYPGANMALIKSVLQYGITFTFGIKFWAFLKTKLMRNTNVA